jgi:hypothetical protein
MPTALGWTDLMQPVEQGGPVLGSGCAAVSTFLDGGPGHSGEQ